MLRLERRRRSCEEMNSKCRDECENQMNRLTLYGQIMISRIGVEPIPLLFWVGGGRSD